MRKLLALLLLLPLLAHAGTVTGNIQTASSGAVVNGTLTFTLNQFAVVSGTAQVVATGVQCYTSTGGAITGEPDPQTAPVLSVNLGSGTLAAGTYFVKYAYFDGTGESLPSPEASVTLVSPGTVIVAVPAIQPANATGWRVYISAATGTETRQSSQTGFAASYQQTAALSAGTALPGTNTSACSIRFTDELIPSTTYFTINLVNSLGSKIAGYPISQARFYGGTNGSVNVSSGWPVSIGGVIWPSPIVSTPNSNTEQSISSNLNLNGFTLKAANGIFSGNVSAGTLTAKSLNSSTYLFVDQLAGSDFCVKMNACDAALLLVGGGVCDARALVATQSCSVTWGASTNQVRHFLGDMTLNCGVLNPCVNWSANGANLEGASWNNTIFSTASGTADIIKVTSVGSQSHFNNFKTTSSVVRTAGAALHIQGGNNTWERIWMEPTFNGIVLDTAGTGGNNFFDKLEIQGGGSGAAWNCGVLVGGVATNNVASNQFHHLAFLSNGPAFSDAQFCIQDGADSTTIESSMFVANVGGADAVGLHLERVNGGNAPSNTKISDLTIEGGVTKNGIVIDSANGVDFTGGTVQTSLKGLLVNAGTRITWNGGLFFNNQNEGIRVAALDALGTFEVTNTRFGNNGLAANNTWDDIFVAAAVSGFVINSNTFRPINATAVLPKNNIEVAAGASDNYSMIGNIFPGTTFGTAKITDAGTGINKILCNASDANVTVSGCQGLIINSSGIPQISIQSSKGPYFNAIRIANGSASSVVWTSGSVDPNGGAPDTGISVPGAGVLAFGNGAIAPGDVSGTIEGAHIGATAKPWTDVFLGTAATNNFKVQPAATTGARIITMADPLSPTTVALPMTIGSGTASMTTAGILTGACGTTVTAAATGVLTTDVIDVTRNAAATIGNGGGLTLNAWPTAGNVNFNYCNSSAGTITPTAMTVNWSVRRP